MQYSFQVGVGCVGEGACWASGTYFIGVRSAVDGDELACGALAGSGAGLVGGCGAGGLDGLAVLVACGPWGAGGCGVGVVIPSAVGARSGFGRAAGAKGSGRTDSAIRAGMAWLTAYLLGLRRFVSARPGAKDKK